MGYFSLDLIRNSLFKLNFVLFLSIAFYSNFGTVIAATNNSSQDSVANPSDITQQTYQKNSENKKTQAKRSWKDYAKKITCALPFAPEKIRLTALDLAGENPFIKESERDLQVNKRKSLLYSRRLHAAVMVSLLFGGQIASHLRYGAERMISYGTQITQYLPDLPGGQFLPRYTIYETRPELIEYAKRGIEEGKKGKPLPKGAVDFFVGAEFAANPEQLPKLVKEENVKAEYKNFLAKIETQFPNKVLTEEEFNRFRSMVGIQFWKNYKLKYPTCSTYIAEGVNGANCQGETYLFNALWADAGFRLANPNHQIGVQIYSDHIQTVLIKKSKADGEQEKLEAIEILSGQKQASGTEAPVFHPSYLLVAYLRATGNNPGITPDPELLIAKPEGMDKLSGPILNIGMSSPDTVVQAPYLFSEGRGKYTEGPIPESATRSTSTFAAFGEDKSPLHNNNVGGKIEATNLEQKIKQFELTYNYRGVNLDLAELEQQLGYGPFLTIEEEYDKFSYGVRTKNTYSGFRSQGEKVTKVHLSNDKVFQSNDNHLITQSDLERISLQLIVNLKNDKKWKDFQIIRQQPALFLKWEQKQKREFLNYLQAIALARKQLLWIKESIDFHRLSLISLLEHSEGLIVAGFLNDTQTQFSKESFLTPIETLTWFDSLDTQQKLEIAEFDHWLSFLMYNRGYFANYHVKEKFHEQRTRLPLGRVFTQGGIFDILVESKNSKPKKWQENKEAIKQHIDERLAEILKNADTLENDIKGSEIQDNSEIKASEVIWLDPKRVDTGKIKPQKTVSKTVSNDKSSRALPDTLQSRDISISYETQLLLTFMYRNASADGVYHYAFGSTFDGEPIEEEYTRGYTNPVRQYAFNQNLPYKEKEYLEVLLPLQRRLIQVESGREPVSRNNPLMTLDVYLTAPYWHMINKKYEEFTLPPGITKVDSIFDGVQFDFYKALRSGDVSILSTSHFTRWATARSHHLSQDSQVGGSSIQGERIPRAIAREYLRYYERSVKPSARQIDLILESER